jgi:hypothetical protein
MTIPSNVANRFASKIGELDEKWCHGCLRPLHPDKPCDKRSAKMLESIKTVIEKNCPELNKFQQTWALHSLDGSCTTGYITGRMNNSQQGGAKGKSAKKIKVSEPEPESE